MNTLRFLFNLPNIRVVVGGIILLGLMAVVTAIFPGVNRSELALAGAFGIAGMVAFVLF